MTVDTGRSALNILLSRDHRVNLVVMSTNLPDMCVFKFISKLEKLMRMAVVMICNVCDQDTIVEGYMSGAMHCLVKPLCFQDIIDLSQLPILKRNEFMLDCSRFLMSGSEVNGGTIGQSSNFFWTPEVNNKFVQVILDLGSFQPTPSMIARYINATGVSIQLVAEKLEQYLDYLTERHLSLYQMVCPNLLDMSAQHIGECDNGEEDNNCTGYETGESHLARYLENPYSREQLKRVINVAILKWEGEPNGVSVVPPPPPPPPTTEVPPVSLPFALAREIERFIHINRAVNIGPPGFLQEVAILVGSFGPSASAELEGNGAEVEADFLKRLDVDHIFDAIEELREW